MIARSKYPFGILFLILFAFIICCKAEPAREIGFYGLVLTPSGPEAANYSDPGIGIGVRALFPSNSLSKIFAQVGGIDYISLSSETTYLSWYEYNSEARQLCSQSYVRIFYGGEIGGHGYGFFRPHAGVDVALIGYWLYRRVQTLDISTNEWETVNVQDFRFRPSLGVDLSVGLDLNFSSKWNLDFGFRILRSLFVPLQLGDETVTIFPQYGEFYIGASFPY
jgi:hypothetical protein